VDAIAFGKGGGSGPDRPKAGRAGTQFSAISDQIFAGTSPRQCARLAINRCSKQGSSCQQDVTKVFTGGKKVATGWASDDYDVKPFASSFGLQSCLRNSITDG